MPEAAKQPFVDGNKRTALASALVFLSLNGVELEDPKQDLYRLMLNVARSKAGKAEIAEELRRLGASRQKRI